MRVYARVCLPLRVYPAKLHRTGVLRAQEAVGRELVNIQHWKRTKWTQALGPEMRFGMGRFDSLKRNLTWLNGRSELVPIFRPLCVVVRLDVESRYKLLSLQSIYYFIIAIEVCRRYSSRSVREWFCISWDENSIETMLACCWRTLAQKMAEPRRCGGLIRNGCTRLMRYAKGWFA